MNSGMNKIGRCWMRPSLPFESRLAWAESRVQKLEQKYYIVELLEQNGKLLRKEKNQKWLNILDERMRSPDELCAGEVGYFNLALAITDNILDADKIYDSWTFDKVYEYYLKQAATTYEPYSKAR